jgi:outer membrane protein OmpA-like peptidoglycan-associated protein
MPGQSSETGGIHLHLPAKHHATAKRKAAPASPAPTGAEASPIPYGSIGPDLSPPAPARQRTAARPKPAAPGAPSLAKTLSRTERRKAVQEVLAAPANSGTTPQSDLDASSGAIPFTFDAESPPPAPAKTVRPQQKARSSSVAKPRQTLASLGPLPKQTAAAAKHSDPHAGLTKEGEVVFPANGTDLSTDGSDQLKSLATNLNSALDAGAARVQIEAYGGNPGDKSSDARRLSLRRALAVRQLLIDSGIPTDRIDVRALGGADDRGNADRVDVFLRGAT